MNVIRWEPFREVDEMLRQYSPLFSRALHRNRGEAGEWTPVADISETDQEYVIKAELAKLMSSFIPALGGFPGAAAAGAAGAAGSAGGAASSVGVLAAVAHSGALVGITQTPVRTVPRAWFADAPRFHNGGLAADERTAILQTNEEVLTADNPRHVRNWGGGGATPDINIRNVLVADPELVPSHMASAAGERIIMNTLTRNVSTVRQLVR